MSEYEYGDDDARLAKLERLVTDGGALTGIGYSDRTTGAQSAVACDGLFVAIGLIPENEAFKDLARLNDRGYFDSDEACLTRTPGVFAAGDVADPHYRQAITAAASGCKAAIEADRFLREC